MTSYEAPELDHGSTPTLITTGQSSPHSRGEGSYESRWPASAAVLVAIALLVVVLVAARAVNILA